MRVPNEVTKPVLSSRDISFSEMSLHSKFPSKNDKAVVVVVKNKIKLMLMIAPNTQTFVKKQDIRNGASKSDLPASASGTNQDDLKYFPSTSRFQ